MDKYKVNVLNEMLNKMKRDEYYLCRLKGDDTNAINLDEEAIKLLIRYYSGKRIERKKYYSLVVSVLDAYENREEAHEITGSNNKKEILVAREELDKEISNGKYNMFKDDFCTLSADIEVRDDDTWELLYIM